MAKCKRCNKGGLFFKVNANGICKDCERIVKLEQQEAHLKDEIKNLQNKHQETEQSYNDIKERRDALIKIEMPEKEEPAKDIVPAKKPETPSLHVGNFKVHDDIKHLLWFGDGKLMNLTREEMTSDKDVFTLMGSRVGMVGMSIGNRQKNYFFC